MLILRGSQRISEGQDHKVITELCEAVRVKLTGITENLSQIFAYKLLLGGCEQGNSSRQWVFFKFYVKERNLSSHSDDFTQRVALP